MCVFRLARHVHLSVEARVRCNVCVLQESAHEQVQGKGGSTACDPSFCLSQENNMLVLA
jgi:hypothetical protein